MAFCQKCGTQMADGAKFCPSCGTAVGSAGDKMYEKHHFYDKPYNIFTCAGRVCTIYHY